MTADTLLVAADEVHSHKPLDERQLRVLENGTDKAGEVLVASSTMETPVLGHLAVVLSAIRADNVTVFPSAVDDGFPTLLVGVEVGCERDDVVELAEVYHNQ